MASWHGHGSRRRANLRWAGGDLGEDSPAASTATNLKHYDVIAAVHWDTEFDRRSGNHQFDTAGLRERGFITGMMDGRRTLAVEARLECRRFN